MAKVTGVTLPSDLDDTDVATEANFFNPVYESLSGLDTAVGKDETIYHTTEKLSFSETSETTMWTMTIPADTLGTGNIVKFKMFFYDVKEFYRFEVFCCHNHCSLFDK